MHTKNYISAQMVFVRVGFVLLYYASGISGLADPSDSNEQLQEFNKGNLENIKSSRAKESSHNKIALSSKKILSNVAIIYANCSTFQDSGIKTLRFPFNDSEGVYRIVFHTAFRRGGEYRFAYRGSFYGGDFEEPTILWHNGQITMVSEEGTAKFRKKESLGRAAAEQTGVSFGTAHTIPALIMPKEMGGRRITSLKNVKAPVRVQLKDKQCYQLEGKSGDKKMVLWIEEDTFSILKIEEYEISQGKPSITTTEYVPVINKKIHDALLEKEIDGEWEGIQELVPKIKESR